MPQARGCLGFSSKASPLSGVGAQTWRHDLEGNAALQGNLLGFEHDPHAPASDLADDLELAEPRGQRRFRSRGLTDRVEQAEEAPESRGVIRVVPQDRFTVDGLPTVQPV